jgi:small subunit ribosomal protein S7
MRGKRAKKRDLKPDGKYGSKVITKFINYTMMDGKKSIATEVVYKALDILADKTKMKALDAFTKAIDTVKPKMEVRSRRVGGANYQVPTPVDTERQLSLAFRWIIDGARKSRKKTDFATQLAIELVDAMNKEGAAYKKKEEALKMAEANKAFSHFSW